MREKIQRKLKRYVIAVVGGVVLLLGIVMIPYPGPGWAVVFVGLGILSTEFTWAQRLLHYARGKYDAWSDWLKEQNRYVQAVFWLLTGLVVVVTIWLLDGYGIINHLLNLNQDWLDSPVPFLS